MLPEKERAIIQAYLDGMGTDAIAETFHTGSLSRILKRNNIPLRSVTKKQSATAICKQCGIEKDKSLFCGRICGPCNNRNRLKKKCAKLGILVPPPHRLGKTKICIDCGQSKETALFHGKTCLDCFNRKRRKLNAEPDTHTRLLKSKKDWYERQKSNTMFKLHMTISSSIRVALKRRGHSKNKASILDHLPFTIEQLKAHLEEQFEPWMTWNNWGKYNAKTWDDNDQSTWKWNLEHIIPHSSFSYSSMKDEPFKQCWSLRNLRPLSAKANIIKGARIK